MNIKKLTNAIKKAIENTNKVTQENKAKNFNKSADTYDANIFTGSKEDWKKQDNKLFNSLEEQGYNKEDLHTLFDTNQDGIISEEESLYIAGLDGNEEISEEDLEVYLAELSTIDISSLGNTEEEIITFAEKKVPIFDFNDTNIKEKLFDFLGINFEDNKFSRNTNEIEFRQNMDALLEEYPQALDSLLEDINIEEITLHNFYGLSSEELSTLQIPTENNSQKINNVLKEIVTYDILSNAYLNDPTSDFYNYTVKALKNIYNEEFDVNLILSEDLTHYTGIDTRELYKQYSENQYFKMTLDALNLRSVNNEYEIDSLLLYLANDESIQFTEQYNQEEIIKEKFNIDGDYTTSFSLDENGNTISEIKYTTTDGEEVCISTTFDKETNKIIGQNQTSIWYGSKFVVNTSFNEDGSFITTTSIYDIESTNPEDIRTYTNSSEELLLTSLNNYGESIEENITGNSGLADNIRNCSDVETAYQSIVDFCLGDKETARKIFNGIYSQDNIFIDENFNFNTENKENPLHQEDMTAVTDRIFSIRSQERVINNNLLQQFGSFETSIFTTPQGESVELPSKGTEYYINGDGVLCFNEYEIKFNPDGTTEITSHNYDVADNKLLYDETAVYYTNEEGIERVKITRKNATSKEETTIDETYEQYERRLIVEKYYSIDTNSDKDNIVQLNLSSEQIDEIYILMLQDQRYSSIISQFGNELNSQGVIDQAYNWLKGVLGAENAESITDEIVARTKMTPILNAFAQGDETTALKETKKEYERRINEANTFEEIYNITLSYYNDPSIAFEYTQAYISENENRILGHFNLSSAEFSCNITYNEENQISINFDRRRFEVPFDAEFIELYDCSIDKKLKEDSRYQNFAQNINEEEFLANIETVSSVEELYRYALDSCGDETLSTEFVNAYIEHNFNQITQYSGVDNSYYCEAEFSFDEDGNALFIASNIKEKDTHFLNVPLSELYPIGMSKNITLDDETINAMEIGGPKNFDSLYTFWTKGGVYNEENLQTFELTNKIFSIYNNSIASANSFEETLAEAKTPEAIFNIFLEQSNGNKEEAIKAFNTYYSQFLSSDNSFENPSNKKPLDVNKSFNVMITEKDFSGLEYHSYCSPTSINAILGENGIEIVIGYGKTGKTISYPLNSDNYSEKENITTFLNGVNKKVNEYDLLAQIACDKFEDEYRTLFNDKSLPPEDMTYSEYTKYMNNMYTDAFTNLYGESDVANLVNSYSQDMASYASTITAFIQMGSIGLSFVCPAFGFVAMGAGFIDNTFDLINMGTNKQYDDYGKWLKNTGFEIGCLAGGMLLGKFANFVGNQASFATLQKTHNIARAHFVGTTTEVVVDVVTGFGFDFATSGGKDWNLEGNAFSGLLDIVSGMRGYKALASGRGQLRLDSAKFSDDGTSVTMRDIGNNEVQLLCIGYDKQGNLIYGNNKGQMLAFGSKNGIDISGFTYNEMMGNLTNNPLLAIKLFNDGIRFNPANGQFEIPNVKGEYKGIDIETAVDDFGNSYMRQPILDDNGTLAFTRITPTDFLTQSNSVDCGYAAIINKAMTTPEGIQQLQGSIIQYPNGKLAVETPTGRIDLADDITLDKGIMAIYEEVMPKSIYEGGSFADETAALMGLNPIRVEISETGTFSTDAINSLRSMNDDSVLLLGIRYEDGTGHYLTIKDIDENGIATVIDPLTPNVEQKIDLTKPSDEFKIEEISGGTSKAIDGELYTARPEDVKPFGGVESLDFPSKELDEVKTKFKEQLLKSGFDEESAQTITETLNGYFTRKINDAIKHSNEEGVNILTNWRPEFAQQDENGQFSAAIEFLTQKNGALDSFLANFNKFTPETQFHAKRLLTGYLEENLDIYSIERISKILANFEGEISNLENPVFFIPQSGKSYDIISAIYTTINPNVQFIRGTANLETYIKNNPINNNVVILDDFIASGDSVCDIYRRIEGFVGDKNQIHMFSVAATKEGLSKISTELGDESNLHVHFGEEKIQLRQTDFYKNLTVTFRDKPSIVQQQFLEALLGGYTKTKNQYSFGNYCVLFEYMAPNNNSFFGAKMLQSLYSGPSVAIKNGGKTIGTAYNGNVQFPPPHLKETIERTLNANK